jgi:hypothetical protein
MERMLKTKGGHVVAQRAFGPRDRTGSSAAELASEILAALAPEPHHVEAV